MGSNSKETLEYIVALLGKKTWYKRSMGRTFSRQGSSSTNWDVVGRELAKMPKGDCVLFISTIGAFYSKLYSLNEHPNYSNLYEPWQNNIEKLYNHKRELEYIENSDYKLLYDLGLEFARPMEKIQMEKVNKNELKSLFRTGVIQYEDLKINN